MLSENYKNALKGFHAQSDGKSSPFLDGCEAEIQYLYRIIMTENVPVNEIDE